MTTATKVALGSLTGACALAIAVFAFFANDAAGEQQRRFEACMSQRGISAEDLRDYPDLQNSLEAEVCRDQRERGELSVP